MTTKRILLITAIAMVAVVGGILWLQAAREKSLEAEKRKAMHGDFDTRFQPTLPPLPQDPPPR